MRLRALPGRLVTAVMVTLAAALLTAGCGGESAGSSRPSSAGTPVSDPDVGGAEPRSVAPSGDVVDGPPEQGAGGGPPASEQPGGRRPAEDDPPEGLPRDGRGDGAGASEDEDEDDPPVPMPDDLPDESGDNPPDDWPGISRPRDDMPPPQNEGSPGAAEQSDSPPPPPPGPTPSGPA